MSESATEVLRRMLDERGVEWVCYGHENHTWWNGWHAENRPSPNGLFVKVEGVVTPEQAIAATLGGGECERTTTRNGKFKTKYGRKVPLCECCGYAIGDDRYNFCPKCGARIVEAVKR